VYPAWKSGATSLNSTGVFAFTCLDIVVTSCRSPVTSPCKSEYSVCKLLIADSLEITLSLKSLTL